MCGSGTMLLAGLDHGASKVIGIDRVPKYLRVARKRVEDPSAPATSTKTRRGSLRSMGAGGCAPAMK
jgi:hypothetical protein